MIRAVSFDLWDTLVADDSDEPRRRALGLPPKARARRVLLLDALAGRCRVEDALSAMDEADAWARRQWLEHARTPPVAERLDAALRRLGLERPPGFQALVRSVEELETQLPQDLAPGAVEALSALGSRYELAVISDAIFTPGRCLRRILADHGILGRFRSLVFSDEVGASKPSPVPFRRACSELGVAPGQLVHVGDRERNDVEGALAVGARAVRYTGLRDRGGSRAVPTCSDLRRLPEILSRMESA